MKMLVLLLLLLPGVTYSQSVAKKQIDSLAYVKELPYMCETTSPVPGDAGDLPPERGCGDRLFWEAVKLKGEAIPYLIAQLHNAKETEAPVLFFGGNYTVGEIAYSVLEEIIHGIPTAKLLNVNPDDYDCGYCYYFQTLRASKENRKKFKQAVSGWYDKNKSKLSWVESNSFQTCECGGKHPNGGHFEVQEK